ncbi:hypothetical protein ColTof4_03594 [Colletotrichum tofieldiae]|nr:hypothetical protein ColTof3_12983 [Colletotrichum tofieldiae]GKT71171.1 hypothetical protein ColTof4_03594 [Colletotrichum tofieldiae]GKT93918.1 hypothetical protein Ct61P_11768 [Colletotrichum tofieldiae]
MTEAVAPPIPASAAKKKFATPPVKIACLAWYVFPLPRHRSWPASGCRVSMWPIALLWHGLHLAGALEL